MGRFFTTAFVLFALLAGFPEKVNATHIVGGQLYYTCIGTNSYLVHMTLYRDCSPGTATLPTTLTIDISSPGCPMITSIPLTLIPGSGNEITPLCPGWPSPCQGGLPEPSFGISLFEYEGLLIIPTGSTCTQIYMSWRLCCREGINSNDHFYLQTTINRLLNQCNSSPRFLNDPFPFICGGEEFVYNPGAYDPDGDSLAFSLFPCQTDSSAYFHQAPLDYLQPFHTAGPITLDSRTGTIRFTPAINQIGTYCIKVEEYRNGVLIGYTIRDFRKIVVSCNNEPPTATGMNGTQKFDTVLCPGQTLVFSVSSTDPTPLQSVTMTGNDGIPGASFTTTGGQYPVGTFTWTPTPADGGTHIFTVNVMDDGCPLVSQNTYAFLIKVRETKVHLPDTLAQCNGKPAVLEPGMVYPTSGFTNFQWSPATGVANPSSLYTSFNPSVPTTYTLTSTQSVCASPPGTSTMTVLPVYLSPTIAWHQIMLVASPSNLDFQWARCMWRTHVPIPGATGPFFAPTASGSYAVIGSNRHCSVASSCYKFTLPSEQRPTFPGQHSPFKRGEDSEPWQAMRVYPNPTSGVLHVEVAVEEAAGYGLSLVTSTGQVVHQEQLEAEPGNSLFTINISQLPAGLYLVALDGPEGRSLVKVVVME